MKITANDLWVCSDCIMAIANGEHASNEHDAAFAAACEREAPARWVPEGPHKGEHAPACGACIGDGKDDYEDDGVCRKCNGSGAIDEPEGADTLEFSWDECDCCRSPLGGGRHRCALIEP